nr:vWA domain-containing protein [Kofleriaceae bacterium]
MFASCVFAAVLGVGCGPKQNGSLCDQAQPPPTCDQTCDPTPGADNSCPAGFHCSADGKCDSECSPGSTCSDGSTCTADGTCPGGGGGGGGGGVGGGGGGSIDANCPNVDFTATPVTPSIDLVIDRSGSMDGTDISPTRYKAIQNGLVGASGVVATEQANVYFGAIMFAGDQTPCLNLNGFTTPRALNNASAITTLLANNPPNNGNTPTDQAILAAIADFAANPPPSGSPPIILLTTDGEPNSCTDGNTNDGPSIAAATAANAAGVRLFILGLASLNTNYLQEMANAGVGEPAGMNAPFFTADNPTQLQQSLQTIINGVLSCDLTLSGQVDPTTAMNGTVTLNGTTLSYGTDWTVLADGKTLEIEGGACTTLKDATNPTVTASFPCGTVIE